MLINLKLLYILLLIVRFFLNSTCLLLWKLYWFMKLANHRVLFWFTFYTKSQLGGGHTKKIRTFTFLSNKKCTQSCEEVLKVKEKLSSLACLRGCLTPVLSWFPQQDAPLRFRCGYQPWIQAVSGNPGGGVGDGELFAVMQKSDWHLLATSCCSALPKTGARLLTPVGSFDPVKHKRTSLCESSTAAVFCSEAPQTSTALTSPTE